MRSAEDALSQWDSDPGAEFPRIVSGIYSGTAMLNRLLSRKGRRIGAIVTAGQEDYLKFERGIQTYLGYSYSDRLHIATHHHNEPLVPRDRMKGVRGRIDVMGEEVLPLREEEVRDAAEQLLDDGVEGIVVSLLFSYRNAEHEIRVGEILEEVKASRSLDGDVPGLPLQHALPDAPRPAAAELHPDRGLRGRAVPRARSRRCAT